MIFDINEDTTDEFSLLKAINDTVEEIPAMSQKEFDEKLYFVINGHELTFEENENMGMPFIDERNRTLFPIRKPLETIGAALLFDEGKSIVTAKKGATTIQIPINKDYILVNDAILNMDTIAFIKDGRTYIPLRFVFEGFGYHIEWHEGSRTIIIDK